MMTTLQIPQSRREAISQAVDRAYRDAEINLDSLKPGIVPLYSLIQSYPISVDEIQDMTAQKVADFLEAETGQTILIPEDKGRLAPEFLVSKQAMKRRLVELRIIEKSEQVSV